MCSEAQDDERAPSHYNATIEFGIEVVALPDAEPCCGFGGTFAIKNADTSIAMLGDKLHAVRETRAEVCVAADTSCLMHIGGALHRRRAGVRTMHIAEVLACIE